MGVGAQDVMGRVAASIGDLESVAPEFQPVLDVPNGGVLFALPALLSMGLLKYTEQFFKLPKGYYGLDSLFLLLAFMAFTRLKSIESLRYCAPGEWGKLLGLDRIPEARTLRVKVQKLSEDNQAKSWSAEMCWNQPRNRLEFYTLMVMCASITVSKPNCPSIMLHGKSSVFERPPTIGSMPWMDSLLWSLTRP